MAERIVKKGSRKYSMYNIQYKIVDLPRSYMNALYMKYGSRPWRNMGTVQPCITSKAIYDYARDYVYALNLIKRPK